MNWYRYIFILIILATSSEVLSDSNLAKESKEFSFLKILYEEGNNNSSLLFRLSQLAPNSAEALCYARLGLEATPDSIELKNRIDSLRNNAKINSEVPIGVKATPPSPFFLILMNFISKNQLSLIFSVISTGAILLFIGRLIFNFPSGLKRLHLFLYLISFVLFVQLFLITRTLDGRYRIISSLRDFNKIQGVVLAERNVYSAPSDTSQQMNLLKPSWEIDIYRVKGSEPWLLVDTNDKRQGWMDGLEDICIITN